MEKILEGIVIGVVIAVILGGYDWIRRRYRRKEQIRHIKRVIGKAENRIQKAGDDVQKAVQFAPEEVRAKVGTNPLRFKHYQWLIRELTMILEDRSGELSYEQRYELREFLETQEEIYNSLFPKTKKAPPMWFYERYVFKALRKIKWIQITPPC